MRVLLAQINTTPGDFDGNFIEIKEQIRKARSGDIDIVVFPELTIPGYLSKDLMYSTQYIEKKSNLSK